MTGLFGTDGIRGVANRELTPDLALALARAAGLVLVSDGGEVVIGRDTRLSGQMLEAALIAGLCSAGADVRLAGIIPTPGVAWLTVDQQASAGAMISASHNPVADNGIKFFSDEGLKTSSEVELAIEDCMRSFEGRLPEGSGIGVVRRLDDAHDRYMHHLLSSLEGTRLAGLRIVLDCAFGAAWELAPATFREAGAHCVAINAEPDGARINVGCGSTDMAGLAQRVRAERADLGLAFDGDADRVLAVDERGEVVDGDRIIGMSAISMRVRDRLRNNLVVATVMSNLGFLRALEHRGIEVITAPVGDKFVADAMGQAGASLGGEQSGHVIFADYATTGDGILTGLQIARSLVDSGERLSVLADFFEPFPQVLVNVEVDSRDALAGAEPIWDEVRATEERLGPDGRVLVRASGTEHLVRVMVEASDAATANHAAHALAEVVARELGASADHTRAP